MPCNKHQRGAVALGTALLLLVLISWIVVAAVRIASGDQRSLGNEIARRETLAIAESGLARGIAYLSRHPGVVRGTDATGWLNPTATHWSPCASSDTAPPCGDGLRNHHGADVSAYRQLAAAEVDQTSGVARVNLLAKTAELQADSTRPVVLTILSQATGIDEGARALVVQDVLIVPLISALPQAPVMAHHARLAGDGSLVANADGFAAGVPLSVWTHGDTQFADTARSCNASMLTADACPIAGAFSSAEREGADVLDTDGQHGSLPDSPVALGDVIERVFGFEASQIESLRSLAQPFDCSQPDAPAPGFIGWSLGDCVLAAGRQLGTAMAPLVLVVDDGELQAEGGAFHGIIVMLSRDASPRLAMLGENFRLSGALLANSELRIEGGRYQVRYDAAVLRALMQSPAAPLAVAPVPGSWRDFP